jgi:hypothetical protein
VGYFTLDPQGVIVDLNLTGAILLGVKGSQKGRHQFASSVAPADRSHLHVISSHRSSRQPKTRLRNHARSHQSAPGSHGKD